ncbi:uncharacterized protein [Chelonus insularis]|uniref:uncharacterized protein n=1 Tax=Chelonus insularis TaxID=460826 RepID=UPI00158C07D8|nr:uncharacterized protein LOC118066604 [Chelonus insularis]
MWKGLLLILLTISINYCSTFESSRLLVTEGLKNVRGINNQKYRLNVDKIDYDENYPADEPGFEGGKLIGKWRSTGAAIEPKWRDGDSIPLVPFEEAATLRRVTKNKEKPLTTGEAIPRELAVSNSLASKLHEIQHAKIRYLNAPVTEIKPIPEFISAFKDVKTYSVEEPQEPVHHKNDFTNSFQNESRRYRLRKPKPIVVNLHEGENPGVAYVREPVVKSSLSSSTEGKQQITGDRMENKKTTVLPGRSEIIRPKSPFENHPEYELNDDEYQRPRPRKRRPPQNYEFSEEGNSDPVPEVKRWPNGLNSGRKNRTRGNPLESEIVNQRMENSELKSLLKMQQIEGLSLSEILQRRNLSLSDLLKGKSDVIKVLKANNTDDDVESISNTRQKDFNPTIVREKTVDRPRWRINPRIKSKDRRRNQFSTMTMTTSTMTTPTPISTTMWFEKNYWAETKDDLNRQIIEPMKGNERKSKESDIKSSTKAIAKLTEANIFARFNSSGRKPVAISTTVETIKEEDPVVKYEPKKQLTTVPSSTEDDEIMEFSDFSTKTSSLDDKVAKSVVTTTLKPDVTSPRHQATTVIAGYNDIGRDDGGSTLSIEHILSTEPTKSTAATANRHIDEDNKFNTLIEYNKSENDADCNDEGMIDYQNDGENSRDQEYDNGGTMDGEEYYDLPETTTIEMTTPISITTTEDFETTQISYEDEEETEIPPNHRPEPSNMFLNNKRYEQVISEIEPEARAEIFEVISSGSSTHLEKLLRSRNMSLDELISLRQRGSSQAHLAGFARPKSRSHKFIEKPTIRSYVPSSTESIRSTIPTTIPSLSSFRSSQFKINVEEITLKPSPTTPLITTIITTTTSTTSTPTTTPATTTLLADEVTENTKSDSRIVNVTDKTPIVINISCTDDKKEEKIQAVFEKNSLELVDLLNAFDSLPFAIHKHVEKILIPTSTEISPVTEKKEEIKIVNEEVLDVIMKEKDLNDREILVKSPEVGSVEEIIKKFEAEESTSTTESDLAHSIHEKERKTLSKVKPSIIASGVILGMTIVGFLALFITCRIRQKQRYMYKNTFSKAVFQAPVMNGRKLSNSSSLNTIMVNVVATSTTKRTVQQETQEVEETFDCKSDIDHDSLDANDSWETIPDFMK